MDEVRKYDGAHPRAAGYQVFAEIVQNWEDWLNWFKLQLLFTKHTYYYDFRIYI